MSDKPEKVGALWFRTSGKGTEYFTGDINGLKVVVFQNKHKTTEKHPDWVIYKSTPRDAA